MRECRTSGSVRGVPSNGHPYRNQSQGQSHEPARWVQRQVEQTGMPVALRASTLLMHVEAIRAGAA